MRCRGFTLIEILVAVAILAISAMAIMKQTHTTIAQQQTLQQKTLALWVAENQLQTMRSAQRWPELGRKSQAYEKGGFSFRVETVVSPTSHPTLRQIEVAVIDPLGDDVRLIEMTAFRGLH